MKALKIIGGLTLFFGVLFAATTSYTPETLDEKLTLTIGFLMIIVGAIFTIIGYNKLKTWKH